MTGLRALAAFIVFASHASNAGYHLAFGFSFGGTGKIGLWLFFVLSAHLLAGQFFASDDIRLSDLGPYLIRRIFRVLPLYYVALPLFFVISSANVTLLWPSLFLISAPDTLWSVPVEYRFYLVLPLLVAASMWLRQRYGELAMLIPVVALVIVDRYVEGEYWGAFAAGVFSAWCLQYRLKFARRLALFWPCAAIVFIGSLPIARSVHGFDPTVQYIAWGFLFVPVILATHLGGAVSQVMARRPVVWLGEMSFAFYVLHYPIIVGLREVGLPDDYGAWVMLGCTLMCSLIAYRLIEQPMRNVGYRLTARAKPALPA